MNLNLNLDLNNDIDNRIPWKKISIEDRLEYLDIYIKNNFNND